MKIQAGAGSGKTKAACIGVAAGCRMAVQRRRRLRILIMAPFHNVIDMLMRELTAMSLALRAHNCGRQEGQLDGWKQPRDVDCAGDIYFAVGQRAACDDDWARRTFDDGLDLVICDEAAVKAWYKTEAMMFALQARCVVLLGDPSQMREEFFTRGMSSVKSVLQYAGSLWNQTDLVEAEGLLAALGSLESGRMRLAEVFFGDQYRMNHPITSLLAQEFYEYKLVSHESVANNDFGSIWRKRTEGIQLGRQSEHDLEVLWAPLCHVEVVRGKSPNVRTRPGSSSRTNPAANSIAAELMILSGLTVQLRVRGCLLFFSARI